MNGNSLKSRRTRIPYVSFNFLKMLCTIFNGFNGVNRNILQSRCRTRLLLISDQTNICFICYHKLDSITLSAFNRSSYQSMPFVRSSCHFQRSKWHDFRLQLKHKTKNKKWKRKKNDEQVRDEMRWKEKRRKKNRKTKTTFAWPPTTTELQMNSFYMSNFSCTCSSLLPFLDTTFNNYCYWCAICLYHFYLKCTSFPVSFVNSVYRFQFTHFSLAHSLALFSSHSRSLAHSGCIGFVR